MSKDKSDLFKASKDYDNHFTINNLVSIEINIEKFNIYKEKGYDFDYMVWRELDNKSNQTPSYDEACLVVKDIKIFADNIIIILENKGEHY